MKQINNEMSTEVLIMGDYVLKLEKEEDLDDYYVKKAAEELRENEEIKANAMKELKQLIFEDETLYMPLDDSIDMYLLAYLRASKFYVHSAFKRIKFLQHCKLKYPEYFNHLTPLTCQNVFSRNIPTILPQRDQHGRRMLLQRVGKQWKPNECSIVEIMRSILLIVEGATLEPKSQIAGAILIMDMEGLSLQHVWQFSPSFAKMLLDWVQEVIPVRLKAVHIIFQPYLFNMIMAIFKPFMERKLKNRIHLHGHDLTSLLKHIDAKYLPTQYGGLMNISLDQGLHQWNFLCNYNELYEKTSHYASSEGLT